MSDIVTHRVNDCNRRLCINRIGRKGAGNAHFIYDIFGYARQLNGEDCFDRSVRLAFQNGPVSDGVNGITHEALLAVLCDRLEAFQGSEFACEENYQALRHLEQAMEILAPRTTRRMAQDVEGTHTV